MKKHQILIVGGGSAGITVAARLMKDHADKKLDIAIIEPSDKHYYQPLWTLVGGGVFDKSETERHQADYIPFGTTWIQDKVSSFEPDQNAITLASGERVAYEYLVVTAGIQLDWNKIKGLPEALGKKGVCSNYSYQTVNKTWEFMQEVTSGNAIFTQPPMPIKCAGAPQKIMYLADDYYRRQGLRDKVNVMFCNTGPRIFGVEKYRLALEKVVERKEIDARYEHQLIEVRGDHKEAIFQDIKNDKEITIHYEMLHVVPPQSAPDFIKSSPLSNEAGWVDVDKHTLQHTKYPNVFSAGDASSLPTSKTGAAVRKEAPVLVQNMMAHMEGKEMTGHYDGYTSCPLVTGYDSLILAEFDYDGNPAETFPFNQAEERYSMYALKAYGLPRLYWHGMLKGKA
jgi:sulfide:quinone oxidoreductase